MTDEMRKALCQYNIENLTSTQKQLQQWVSEKFNLQVSQTIIANMIKKSSEYLSTNIEKSDAKRHKTAKFPELEKIEDDSSILEHVSCKDVLKAKMHSKQQSHYIIFSCNTRK